MWTSFWKPKVAQAVRIAVRTATKRASGGKSANNNTAGRRLGPKVGQSEPVTAGQILYRQRGTRFYPGENAGIGRDHTIFALEPGFARFYRDPFHPKRQFIGVALSQSHQLPTPHFAPRRRRFGYVPIESEEIASFEQAYFRKKEVERSVKLDKQFHRRELLRAQREHSFAAKIAEITSDIDSKAAAARLDAIYQFMHGGSTYEEAASLVDKHAIQDFEVDLRVGRIDQETFNAETTAYQNLASAADSRVVLSPRFQVVSRADLDNAEEKRQSIIKELDELVGAVEVNPIEGTPKETREKITDLLSSEVFTPKDVARLSMRYIRKPVPVPYSEDADALVKKGKGKIMTVWNDEKRKMQKFFVPTGAAMIFNF